MRSFFIGLLISAALTSSFAHADIVLYQIPGTHSTVVLQGKVTANPGRTVTFSHPQMGRLYFRLEDVRWYKSPPTNTIARRQLQKAVADQDVEACLEAASWALHNGLLPQFYEAASAAWKISPNHPTVKRLAELKRKMDAPVPVSKKQETELQEFVKNSKRMKFVRSKHFILLHDTSDTPLGRGKDKKTRAEKRLELLETVYESFMLKFCLAGVELPVPKEHLKTVLFSHEDEFKTFSTGLAPSLAKAAGFYSKKVQTSVFYDQGTNDLYEVLDKVNVELRSLKKEAMRRRGPGTADLVRLADTLDLLTKVAKENADIEVVSHEATHHMAGVTSLMPDEAKVPTWAAEGLATYFESPKEASWSGIGSVNEERLEWYRALSGDREHCNISFIVSDQIFTRAGDLKSTLHGYGQSWALTHFLMERHPKKLIEYYAEAAKLQGEEEDKLPTPEKNLEAFKKVFGEDLTALEMEWQSYMRDLKTDVEMVLGE